MNPQNYATLEASKRLVKAGIVLETDYVWCWIVSIHPKDEWKLLLVDTDSYKTFHYYRPERCIPAPCFCEAWRELPNFIDRNGLYLQPNLVKLANEDEDYPERCSAFYAHLDDRPVPCVHQNNNPTDALIDLLIWVKGERK
jgi:hypothetical protein